MPVTGFYFKHILLDRNKVLLACHMQLCSTLYSHACIINAFRSENCMSNVLWLCELPPEFSSDKKT